MRLLVCGGRDYNDGRAGFARLDTIHNGPHGPIVEVVEGGANGGDSIGRAWCRQRLGKASIRCNADWENLDAPGAVIRRRRDGKLYNANAGFDRNQSMLTEYKPDACCALPGGNGTADMVERAIAAGLKIL